MNWFHRHTIRLYVRNSLWILPAIGIVAGLALAAWLTRYERAMGSQMNLSRDTAQLILATIAGSTFTLLALTCSAVMVAVQLACAQLTPRIIALIYRNPYRKVGLAFMTFNFTFSVALLVRLDAAVPLISSYLAAYGFLLNLAIFILFIDSMGKTLRPSSALRIVGLAARQVIRSVYPLRLQPDSQPPEPVKAISPESHRVVLSDEDGAVLAFNMKGLTALATKERCIFELAPQVGDFIAAGDPLFRLHQHHSRIDDDDLRNLVAIGHERTLEQDPMFAFRIIVDIALKALSPAINDPTTAVLAIDQLHHLLREIGGRSLADGQEEDAAGNVRLVYRTPDWEDFVAMASTEIRHYGRDSIQVQRRLRAMLEDLLQTLPPRRHPIVVKELTLLDLSVRRVFPDADDQTLAEAGDLQGIGGNYDETSEPAIARG